MSMLRYIRDKKLDRNITLIWGNKTLADIPFKNELDEMTKQMSSLIVVYVISGQDDWHGEKGYIDQEKLKRYIKDFDISQFLIGVAEGKLR